MPQETIDFGVTNDEYWTDPFKSQIDIETNLLRAKKEVLAIGVPSTVPIQTHDSLPVAVLRTATMANVAKLRFRENAVLTAMDVTENKLYAYMAIVSDDLAPPPYDGPPPEGMTSETFMIDARKQLDLPWTVGTEYIVSVIMRDKSSNRARVKLEKGGYEDPAVLTYLRERDRRPVTLSITPPPAPSMTDPFAKEIVTLPDYKDRTDSPAIPEAPGIALSPDRVVDLRRQSGCVVRGSFRLPIASRYVVQRPAGAVPDGANLHTALVPISLLVIGSDSVVPKVFPLVVPTYDPVSANGGIVTGYFALDLRASMGFVPTEETFFIYALSGDIQSGPFPMAIVR
jgi:hypothetical protein